MSAPLALRCCPHCSIHPKTIEPQSPPGVLVGKCLVLEYQGQRVLVARPDYFKPTRPQGPSYHMKTIVDVARETFKLPENSQEISFYTTDLQQCFGRGVKIGESAWSHLGDSINFLSVEAGAPLAE